MKDMDSFYVLWNTHFLWITLPQSQGIAGQFCDLSVCVCCSSASHLSPSCALVRPHLQQLLKRVELLSYHFWLSVRVSSWVSRHGGSFPAPSSEVGHVCWQADTCSTSLQRGQAVCRGKSLVRAGWGLLDKPSQDPGATSDLSAFHSNARCALLIWLQEQGGMEWGRSTSIRVPMDEERGRMSCGRRWFCFFGALLGYAWNLLTRLMQKLSGIEWMETQIFFLLLTYWSNLSMLSMYILDIYGIRAHH